MPESHLESLYQEARSAIKTRDYEYACELLKRILAVEEDYKDTSRLLAKAVKLRKRRWYNDPRLWGALGAVTVLILGFIVASRIGGIFASSIPTNTPNPTVTRTAMLIATSTHTPQPTPTPTPDLRILNPENQHLYLYVKETHYWTYARDYCAAKGSHLVTIQDASENRFISQLISANTWLGATDMAKEGTWVWVTGEPWNFTSWDRGEPSNSNGGEDFLELPIYLSTSMKWNDVSGGTRYFICEWESGSP